MKLLSSIALSLQFNIDIRFSLIKKISGSLKAYEGYLRVKDDGPEREELPILEAEKLYDYILKKIKEHEKWAKRKR